MRIVKFFLRKAIALLIQFECGDRLFILRGYTNYPIAEFGDIPNEEADTRPVIVFNYDGDKYVSCLVWDEKICKIAVVSIKSGYIYHDRHSYIPMSCINYNKYKNKLFGD